MFEYFDIEFYDSKKTYDKNNTLLVITLHRLDNIDWYHDLYQKGYKLLIDNLWGIPPGSNLSNSMTLMTPNWFWYNESLLYKSLNYNLYVPNKSYNKLALMPMGLIKQSHELLFEAVSDHLDDLIYSYIERLDKYLPDDLPPLFPARKGATGQHQRYFNPEWYNNTYFSLVSETLINDDSSMHATEKTYKPIAFFHPFIIWGQKGILNHLHNQGFESFTNLFNEDYDNRVSIDNRLKIIIDNIKFFNKVPYDSITLDKLQHNHSLFFNTELIKQRIFDEIVNPILEWVETKQ
jgi:hypothetical protein